MTEILCRWLNDELKISSPITPASFAKEFSTGYLIGEVLQKYQLQDDFDQFSKNKTADSKLNNFTRLEPKFHLLGIPFDTNRARNIMTEEHGAATQLLYQLFIALNNKKKANLTGVAMETLQPAAPAKLGIVENAIYKERLKQATPRQTDLDLQALVSHFHENQIKMEQTAFKERFEEVERIYQKRQIERAALIERNRNLKEKQSELVAKINSATVFIPKPPQRTLKAIEARKDAKKKREAEESIQAIHFFEQKMKSTATDDKEDDFDIQTILANDNDRGEPVKLVRTVPNDEYIGKIRKRLQEDSSAREEREKRRRKVLRDQMSAHLAQEEARREEMMINRLMRQSQQERRIAVQLLQARHEKEIIRQNRLLRETQYQERRQKDLEEALDREAEMAALHKLEYAEQLRAEQKLHSAILAQRAEERYRRHYHHCEGVLNSIIDLSFKVAEYRELTNKLLPAKLMKEWKLLFTSGQPLFDVEDLIELTPEQILEEERQKLLNEGDFMEYKTMTGEWQPPTDSGITGPPPDNRWVGHIIHRLFNMVHPPSPPPEPPEFPKFPIRTCLLGKLFSGKSSCAKRLAEEHRLQVLVPEELIQEAVEAFKAGEVETAEQTTQVDFGGAELPNNEMITASDHIFEGVASELSQVKSSTAEVRETSESIKASVDQPENLKPEKETTQTPKIVATEPTAKAKLGAAAFKCLRKGRPVDDQIVIDIITLAIRKIPEGTGWILDGYPQNYTQAKLLERALSGCDPISKDGKKEQKTKSSSLVPDPRPQPLPTDPPSGIDVVVLLDVRDELCLKRAAGRWEQVQAGKVYHEEYDPPPTGSATGMGKVEKVLPVSDPGFNQEQVQTRIAGFLDQWPKLEKWFRKFGTLRTVDASLEKESVFLETQNIFEEVLEKIQNKGKEPLPEIEKPEEVKPEAPGAPPVVATEPVEAPAPGGPEVRSSRPSSKSADRPGSAKSRSSSKEKDKKSKSPKGKKSEVGSSKGKGSRGSSPKSDSARKGGKKAKTPEPEPEVEQVLPPPIKPTDPEWQFVDLDIDMELAKVLATHWDEIERAYINNCQTVFYNTRSERENVLRYFYQIKKDYIAFLKRPDCKQEYVEQWQQTYNSVPDDMRDDEETKAELHQQVDNLRESLWSMCDDRKEQAEREREAIIQDGWMDDRLGLLTNHYLTLMQAEVDRFQDTLRMLTDYYHGMEGQVPNVLNPDYQRLPLIELAVEMVSTPEPTTDNGENGDDEIKSVRSTSTRSLRGKDHIERIKSPRSPKMSKVPSKKNLSGGGKETPQELPRTSDGIGKKIIIPLIHRSGVISEVEFKQANTPKAKGIDRKGTKKPSEELSTSDEAISQDDQDTKLVHHGYNIAVNSVSQLARVEIQAILDEQERLKELEREKEKEKSKPKGGSKKGRSPSPKKNQKKEEADLSPVVPTLSEEELMKKATLERAREEYLYCIREEEQATKIRLDLIRSQVTAILRDLKCKAQEIYKDMVDWLGTRFLKEMESIDQLCEVMRNAIENKEKLKYEICIEQDYFVLDEDFKILKTPSPAPPEVPLEQPITDQFTVSQLNQLYEHLRTLAPNGTISNKAFVELFENLVSVAHGMECLPDSWMHLRSPQIQELGNMLSSDSDYVDWRRLLVALSYPIPTPTQQQLLNSLKHFKAMDQRTTGKVTREQWHRMNLWFGKNSFDGFDRLTQLHNLLFEMFADHTGPIPLLDYMNFLMYFSACPNSYEGFLHALSVACGHHMPRLGGPMHANNAPHVERVASGVDSLLEVENKDDDKPKAEPPMSDDNIPDDAIDALVSVEALHQVLHHGETTKEDSHRFTATANPEDHTSLEKLSSVFQELNEDETLGPVMYRILIEHPLIQDVIAACQQFKALDVKSLLATASPDAVDTNSKTADLTIA